MDTKTIFEQENGNLSLRVDDKTVVEMKVPQTRSTLSLFEGRFIRDPWTQGTQIGDDGFVHHPDGTKLKWFIPYYEECSSKPFFIWEPKLKDPSFLPKLEALRWKLVQYHKKHCDLLWEMVKEIRQLGAAFANCKVCDPKEQCFHLFEKAGDNRGVETINLGYHEGRGKTPVNLELGNAYYRKKRRIGQYQRWISHVASMLDMMIHALHLPTPEFNQTLRLQINGRSYWYRSMAGRWGKLIWERLVYPEADIQEVVVS